MQDSRAHTLLGRKSPLCAIVQLTLDITWICNSSSKLNKSFHIISRRSPQMWLEAWGNSWRSLESNPHCCLPQPSHETLTQSEVCNSSHTLKATYCPLSNALLTLTPPTQPAATVYRLWTLIVPRTFLLKQYFLFKHSWAHLHLRVLRETGTDLLLSRKLLHCLVHYSLSGPYSVQLCQRLLEALAQGLIHIEFNVNILKCWPCSSA